MSPREITYLPTAVPSAKQLAYQDWEWGLFLHFGIRTFYEGHVDWDKRPMSPEGFNPTQLDCDQWVKTAQAAGLRYVILTAKHHDGFANWPSRYTDFSVASSPWKGGKGDIIREFTASCHRHGMKAGLYYSPAEWRPLFEDSAAYDDYFVGQITELTSNYGEIDVLWFDGCGSEGHTFDWPRVIAEIRQRQPGAMIFEGGDPDYRWVWNEAGVAPSPCWNTIDGNRSIDVPDSFAPVAGARPIWLPAECDCRLRSQNWFYSDADEDTIKGIEEMVGLYYYSVGRGCNLTINVAPDRRGLLPDRDVARLLELGSEIRRRFSRPLLTLDDWVPRPGGWQADLAQPLLIDHVIIQEDLTQGEHARRFAVRARPPHCGEPITVYEGYNIGHKAICRFPAIPAEHIALEILEADGPVSLRRLEAHSVADLE